jgi:AcrR family transcriptional regulator
MSISYTETGRSRQKARTEAAMVAAARALLSEGILPTVEQAAERAGVSRATAYRYFKNQRLLIASVHRDISPSLLPADPPHDPMERARLVASEIMRRVLEHETELRAMLRVSLEPHDDEPELPLRKGRRVTWFEDALSPLQDVLSAEHHRRLVLATSAAVGIEPFVWLTDMAGASRREAADVIVSTVEALVRDAIVRHDQRTAPPR